METKHVHICPKCGEKIDQATPVHLVRKAPPRFKSRVALLNMAFLSLMMVLFDYGYSQDNPNAVPGWSVFVVIGLWLLYLLGFAMKFRSEEAWLIIPAFFFMLSVFIGFIDVTTSDSEPILFSLSWSYYPIVTILIILVILPIITFTGRKQRMPMEMLKEIVYLEEEKE